MKQRKICNGVIIAAGILLILSGALEIVSIDLGIQEGVLQKFLKTVFDMIPGVSDGKISFSSYTLLRGVIKVKTDGSMVIGNTALNDMLTYLQVTLLVPYVLAAATIVFGVLKKGWSYVATIVTALAAAAIPLLNAFVMIPDFLSDTLESAMDGLPAGSSLVYQALIPDNAFRRVIAGGMGIGFWVILILCFAVFTASVLGLAADVSEVSARKTKKQRKQKTDEDEIKPSVKPDDKSEIRIPQEKDMITEERPKSSPFADVHPGITCLQGKYAGSRIELSPGEQVIVGRDAKLSHLILQDEKISRRHCGITYDAAAGMYQLIDYSLNGTYLDGNIRVASGQMVQVPRGSVIALGDDRNILRLD